MLQIKTIENLTNEYILDISDELFAQTMAYRTFRTKHIFIDKIKDLTVRYNMMKNIFINIF